MCQVNIYVNNSQIYIYIYHFLLILIIPFDFKFCHGNIFNRLFYLTVARVLTCFIYYLKIWAFRKFMSAKIPGMVQGYHINVPN